MAYPASEADGYDWKYSPATAGNGLTVHWKVLASASTLRMLVTVDRAKGWVGVGFSPDGLMIGSDAVIGWLDSASGAPSVDLYSLEQYGVSGVRRIPSALSSATLTAQTINGVGKYSLAFTRPLCVQNGTGERCVAADSQVAMVWALGDQPSLSYHGAGRGSFALVLSGTSSASGLAIHSQQYRRLAHGVCMLIGWGILLPSGAGVAVGLKDKLGAPLWFRVHMVMQMTGLVVAIVGFAIALLHFDAVAKYGSHGFLGLAVMALGILQPINGFLRPHKAPGEHKTTARRLWEALHKGAGWLALILAMPTIALGVQLLHRLTDADFPGASTAIMGVWIAFATVLALMTVRGYFLTSAVFRVFASSPPPGSHGIDIAHRAPPLNDPHMFKLTRDVI